MMDRVFLDANVIFSAGYKPTGLRKLWDLPDVMLVSSNYAVREAEVNLERIRPEAMAELSALLERVKIYPTPRLSPLPTMVNLVEKDMPILQGAITVRATHLLTGDVKHFGHLFGTSCAGVLVLPPSEYLRTKVSLSD